MPRRVLTPTKQLLVELPLSKYQALEDYCQHKETKHQVIRSLLWRSSQRQLEE